MILYRLLRDNEDPSMGLHAKDPHSSISVADHVAYGSHGLASRYISCSKSLDAIATFAAMSTTHPRRFVEISIKETDYHINLIDLTNMHTLAFYIPPDNVRGRHFAHRFQEVLVERHIPADKIVREFGM